MSTAPTLFDGVRTTLKEAIEHALQSLLVYAQTHKHWAIAYSGGKDSSTVVTLIAYFIETGQIPAPASLTVLYADTRMEIPPLQIAANTWPRGWDGTEAAGDALIDKINRDGTIQPLLLRVLEEG